MSKKAEQKEVIETEYFGYNQPNNEQAGNDGDDNGKRTKPSTIRAQLET